jgi:hypothetical protein
MGLDDLLRPAGHGPAAAREGAGHRPDRAPGIPLDPLHDRGVGPRELLDAALEHGRGVLEGCRGGTGNPADVTLDALHDGGMSPDDGGGGLLDGLDPAGDGPPGFPDDGGRVMVRAVYGFGAADRCCVVCGWNGCVTARWAVLSAVMVCA